MKKLYVIDASGYLYSAYFAIRNMSNSKGESTNALFGFVRSVHKIIKDCGAEHVVAVFDGPNNAKKRKDIYPDYKAHRQSMPEDLGYQIARAQQVCGLLGLPWLSIPDVEADDTMGSIARWAKGLGAHVYLCSGDKDLCQLVSPEVSILNANKEHMVIGPKEVEEIHGIPPHLMIDFLALVGDASDNVPGLPGFGPKTAAKLLLEAGSLDALLAHPEKVAEKKKRETLLSQGQLALLSRQLVTIDQEVDFPKDVQFFLRKEVQKGALTAFYQDMNFKSLLKELATELAEEASLTQLTYTTHLVDDEMALADMLKELSKHQSISFSTLSTQPSSPLQAELVGVAFACAADHAWYIPLNGALGQERVCTVLATLFQDPRHAFYSHNVKHQLHVLQNHNLSPYRIDFDNMIAAHLLYSDRGQHSLEALMQQTFGAIKMTFEALVGKGKAASSQPQVPLEKAAQYCGEEAYYICQLKEILQKEIEERQLSNLLYDLEMPLIGVLTEMEREGIYLDTSYLHTLAVELKAQIVHLQTQIYDLAGEEFNLNSPKQLGEMLLKLGVKSTKKTATGQLKTDSDVLESLKLKYPIAALLLDYRGVEKLRSTYVETLPSEVNPKTGRIHCTFNQTGAATGRLSCQNPNLQNIPTRTEEGKRIRAAFRPQHPGWSYLSADYSQIELRLLAHFSGDPNLVAAFKAAADVHRHTASILFNLPLEQVTAEMRQQAKAVNFGIIYGQQAFGLSQALKMDIGAATTFIEMYFKRYRHVQQFIEQCKEKTRQAGKTLTLQGRERVISDINSKNGHLRSAAERLAVNTPLQGTAADMIKMAMIEISKQLKIQNLQAKMILQIHDELIFEVPDEEIPALRPLVKQAMEQVVQLEVPLVVDIAIGNNWKEC